MMLREARCEVALPGSPACESLDRDDYLKLSAQLRKLLDRVALPRRWSRDEVRDMQKGLKEALREFDRQIAALSSVDDRLAVLRLAREQLSMSPASVPTPAWYLCLLGAWEILTADRSAGRTN